MVQPWDTLDSQTLASTDVFTIRKVTRKSRQSGVRAGFFTLEAPDWINVIALTPGRQIVLIRQFRHGMEEVTLEIPGGIVDSGETPAEAASRELAEETGYTGDAPQLLGSVAPNPAIQNNRCHTYLIESARPTREKHLEELEEIEVELKPHSEVMDSIHQGEINHALVIAAFYWYHQR